MVSVLMASRKGLPVGPRPSALMATTRAPWWAAFWGVLLGLGLALVFFAPAQWVADALRLSTAGRVQLLDAKGTVWRGSARLLLTGGAQSRDAATLPGRVQWTTKAHWRGAVWNVSADCCTRQSIQAHLKLGWKAALLTVDDSTSQWPAAILSGLGTPWNTVLLEGQLSLLTQGLSVEWTGGQMVLRGRAQLDALEVGSRLSTLKPLGSYRLVLSGNPSASVNQAAPAAGEAAQLVLETLSGDLNLTGSGQWVGARLRFNGQASATPEREAALANLLNIMGRRQGPNSIISLG